MNTKAMRTVPSAALPSLPLAPLPVAASARNANPGGRSRDRTCDFDRVKVALYR